MARILKIWSGEFRPVCPTGTQRRCSEREQCEVATEKVRWESFSGEADTVNAYISGQGELWGSKMARRHNPVISGNKPQGGVCRIELQVRGFEQSEVTITEDWEN